MIGDNSVDVTLDDTIIVLKDTLVYVTFDNGDSVLSNVVTEAIVFGKLIKHEWNAHEKDN